MTVASELALTAQEMEYFICIEGIGFPTDETDLSSGFDGDVFVTNDLDGDLASKLGCTIHGGLALPRSISDEINPRTLEYKVGGLPFEITDNDDFLLQNFTPHRSASTTDTLSAVLDYNATTVETTSGNFATGDVVWVGGRECIKLGTKSGTDYTSSTRGYLGTPRGRADFELTGDDAFAWSSATSVVDRYKFYHDRRVLLYAHVPGEAAANCLRLYSGRLRGATVAATSIVWLFESFAERTNGLERLLSPSKKWHLYGDYFAYRSDEMPTTGPIGETFIDTFYRALQLKMLDGDSNVRDLYALASAYQYRTEPGGTAGMKSNAHTTTPQAATIGSDSHILDSMIRVGNNTYLRAIKHLPDAINSIYTEVTSSTLGQWNLTMFNDDTLQVRFMLDNIKDTYETSRFAVNGHVTRNPIDLLLMFLTSGPNEYYIADTTGGTATVPTFAAGVGATDIWKGAALFCVESSASSNKHEMREITANNNTSITVSPGFTNAPDSGAEYQVRNSIYDVLPFGWGLNVHYNRIDISSFETVRDTYLADAKVGHFMMGDRDTYDVWDLLQRNICEPFGILVYVNRTTGKLSAAYVGDAYGDGTLDDYTSIPNGDVLGIGDLDYAIDRPLHIINLTVRSSSRAVVTAHHVRPIHETAAWMEVPYGYTYGDVNDPNVDNRPQTVQITNTDLEGAYTSEKLSTINVSAMFNSVADIDDLQSRLRGRLVRGSVPAPRVTVNVDFEHVVNVQSGKFVSISVDDWPVNPFSNARSWSSVAARVLGTKINLRSRNPSLTLNLELLEAITASKIAPAAKITGTGDHGSGADYISVNNLQYKGDQGSSTYDWHHFAVDDIVELRTKTGALAAGGGTLTITSFGANESSDPTTASTSTINFADGDLSGYSYTAGDYVTFSAWSGSNTTNMDNYSAYADANGDLTGGDSARIYA